MPFLHHAPCRWGSWENWRLYCKHRSFNLPVSKDSLILRPLEVSYHIGRLVLSPLLQLVCLTLLVLLHKQSWWNSFPLKTAPGPAQNYLHMSPLSAVLQLSQLSHGALVVLIKVTSSMGGGGDAGQILTAPLSIMMIWKLLPWSCCRLTGRWYILPLILFLGIAMLVLCNTQLPLRYVPNATSHIYPVSWRNTVKWSRFCPL